MHVYLAVDDNAAGGPGEPSVDQKAHNQTTHVLGNFQGYLAIRSIPKKSILRPLASTDFQAVEEETHD